MDFFSFSLYFEMFNHYIENVIRKNIFLKKILHVFKAVHIILGDQENIFSNTDDHLRKLAGLDIFTFLMAGSNPD